MYQGKHMKKAKKPAALLASLALVFAVAVAGTISFIATQTQGVVNTFTPSGISVKVHETFNGTTKSSVQIENTGDANAYIRAAVVVNWVDESGNVLGRVPVEGTDYSITYDLKNGWVKGDDGYYYWTEIVEATGGTDLTGVLISEATVLKSAPVSEYDLAIDIMAQAIQADGMGKDSNDQDAKPVELAWGVAVNDDGTLDVQ